jgi:hypothetical protein
MSIEIFNSKGQLRTDYSAEELDSLDPEKRERFDRLHAAAVDLEQAEALLREAQASIEKWVKTRAASLQELDRLRPPRTFLMEWAAMKASNQ